MRSSYGACFVRVVAAIGLCAAAVQLPGCNRKSPVAARPSSKPLNAIAAVPKPAPENVDKSASIGSESVDNALAKARNFLYGSSRNNQWGEPNVEDARIGDKTALVLRALLQSGEDRSKPAIANALGPMMQAEFYSTHSIADRLQLRGLLPLNAASKRVIKRDVELEMSSVDMASGLPALHASSTRDTRISLSASAQATNALAEVMRLQVEVPATYWDATQKAWRGVLERELVKGPAISPEGLCAADLMPLLRAMDVLLTAQEQLQMAGGDTKQPAPDTLFEAALKQIQANYPAIFHGPDEFEAIGTFARIMRSRGQRFAAGRDWYQDAATLLLAIQRGDGSWGDGLNDTANAVLFLTRNRAPVLFNKLQYHSADGKEPSWNNRPQDLSHLTRWIGEQKQRPFDWQVLSIDAPIEEWHTAPILYISGDTALEFKPEHLAKIKEFIEKGGMVVGNADSNSASFTGSFVKMGQAMFPHYEFRDLPSDHLLFNISFKRQNWVASPPVRGLTNGVRELMILLPTDQARSWQQSQFAGARQLPSAQLAANVVLYATDKKFVFKEDRLKYHVNPDSIIVISRSNLPWLDAEALKGRIKPSRDFPQLKPIAESPLKVSTLALISADADSVTDPGFEPLRSAMLLKHMRLQVDPLVLGKWTLQRYDVASIAAGQLWALPPLQRLEIKRFIETGGMLFIDASANPEKVPAIEGQLTRLFTEPKLTFGPGTPGDTLLKSTAKPVRIARINNRTAVIVNAHADQADDILQSLLEAHLK